MHYNQRIRFGNVINYFLAIYNVCETKMPIKMNHANRTTLPQHLGHRTEVILGHEQPPFDLFLLSAAQCHMERTQSTAVSRLELDAGEKV